MYCFEGGGDRGESSEVLRGEERGEGRGERGEGRGERGGCFL